MCNQFYMKVIHEHTVLTFAMESQTLLMHTHYRKIN